VAAISGLLGVLGVFGQKWVFLAKSGYFWQNVQNPPKARDSGAQNPAKIQILAKKWAKNGQNPRDSRILTKNNLPWRGIPKPDQIMRRTT